MFTPEDISRYYDLSETHYRRVWQLDKSLSLHYGYWDESVRNFHEALLNINKVLAEWAGIRSGEKVLDAGCGIGGSSIWLAREKQCTVTGISLNETQIKKANRLAKALQLSGQINFDQQDYTHTSYPSSSFDIVWAIESVCYVNDKTEFLQEASRILKPGGRLIIADFFKAGDLRLNEEAMVKQWAAGWAINDFATIEEFNSKLSENNFDSIAWKDATTAIMPSAKRLYRSYFTGIAAARFYQLFHPRATRFGINNIKNARRQYATLKKGLWKYMIVRAGKPE